MVKQLKTDSTKLRHYRKLMQHKIASNFKPIKPIFHIIEMGK